MNTQTWEAVEDMEDVGAVADIPDEVSVAMISQYDHAQRLLALASVVRDQVDATDKLREVVQGITTAETARGVFLDWLGKRIGVSRVVSLDGRNVSLDDDYYRFLIQYRAVANVSDSSIATMNALLSSLIGLPVFVIDNQDMTISVRVFGHPTDLQIVILRNYGLLTRAAGVGFNILIQDPDTSIFGFQGSGLMPFNQGVFNPARELVSMITS